MGLEKWRAKELLFKDKIVMLVLNDVTFYGFTSSTPSFHLSMMILDNINFTK